MKALVVGASGATGRLVVEQLLDRGAAVDIIIRPQSELPERLVGRDNLKVIRAMVTDLSDVELARHVAGCDAVVSCLGHNMTFKGIYGQPRRLVTDTVRRLCEAIQAAPTEHPVKVVLMNTTGNRNKDLNERLTLAERIVLTLIRWLLPPHPDNEQAAEVLRTSIGPNHKNIEWVVVRPDTLTNEPEATAYNEHASPTRSPLFDPGKTSRINVAHFMAELITQKDLWAKWRGQMPVIYNRE